MRARRLPCSAGKTQPFLTHDSTTLIWSGVRGIYAVYAATKSGTTFGNIHAIATPTATAPVVGKVVLLGKFDRRGAHHIEQLTFGQGRLERGQCDDLSRCRSPPTRAVRRAPGTA